MKKITCLISLHLILLRLQLKHPRRLFVWPLRGIGFRGAGGALSPVEVPSGESLEELEWISMFRAAGNNIVGDGEDIRSPSQQVGGDPYGDI